MTVTGSCHCGAISYTLNEEAPTQAAACNCSMCRRKGYLLHFAPAEKFTLDAQPEILGEYLFNKHRIRHHFCTTCGCAPFGRAKGPGGVEMIALNLRCADGIDPDALTITQVDGASR